MIPLDNLPDFEKEFVKLRIKHKLWGEIKWERISQNYLEFADLMRSNWISFHSLCYPTQTPQEIKDKFQGDSNKPQYVFAYTLVRYIGTMLIASKAMPTRMYILPDESGPVGHQEWKNSAGYLKKDSKLSGIEFDFCSQGTSHCVGALQISDLLTGAVAALKNNVTLNQVQENFISRVQSINNNQPLLFNYPYTTPLHNIKVNHFSLPK